jgi:hypothetical protein
VAGKFYAGSKTELKSDLAELFARAEPRSLDHVVALISPHAGYVFSGEVAASSFNQIPDNAEYEHVFILASSHHVAFDGASIYSRGDYITPLGKVNVDNELATKLVDEHKVFTFRKDAHLHEHSLEVQLPFLQYKLGEALNIIPIVVGTQYTGTCKKIAEALKPYFGGNNLFVISTDFSHYPSYNDAVEVDHLTAKSIISNDPDNFLETREKNARKGISNLATSICGWSSVLSLMYMTEGMEDVSYHPLQYKNSGDNTVYGDKYRCVGYHAIGVTMDTKETGQRFSLTEEEQAKLLKLARDAVETYVNTGDTIEPDKQDFGGQLAQNNGAFVTLHKDGKLRGCIGRFEPKIPLYELVVKMAISAATQDYRFSKVQPEELDEIDYEISVLSTLRKIDDMDEIEMGKHGIYIKKGMNSGTYLPQVAEQTKWTKEEFLGNCARNKARIGWDGWKDADIYVYEAFVFDEK